MNKADEIKRLALRGFQQATIARTLGVSQGYVSKVMTGVEVVEFAKPNIVQAYFDHPEYGPDKLAILVGTTPMQVGRVLRERGLRYRGDGGEKP